MKTFKKTFMLSLLVAGSFVANAMDGEHSEEQIAKGLGMSVREYQRALSKQEAADAQESQRFADELNGNEEFMKGLKEIIDQMSEEGIGGEPSEEQIAEDLGMSLREYKRALSKQEAADAQESQRFADELNGDEESMKVLKEIIDQMSKEGMEE